MHLCEAKNKRLLSAQFEHEVTLVALQSWDFS